jgi:hypothetical protein
MSQNHFTISFPLRSPAGAAALESHLPPLMPGMFQANDGIGTIHYSRFTLLSENTLLFLGDFDGGLTELMTDFANSAGSVFDAIFEHVEAPPPTPTRRRGREQRGTPPLICASMTMVRQSEIRMRPVTLELTSRCHVQFAGR